MSIIVKSAEEIAVMREAGKIVAEVLNILTGQIMAGMKTKELDAIAAREAVKRGATPSFKGYRGYPASLCVSINDEIVHGIPGNRVIHEGDVVSLDFGVIYKDFQGDAATTVGVGQVEPRTQALMDAGRGSLEAGIRAAREGNRLGDISSAIQKHAEFMGFSVVREYTGHGIGREMHEDPLVPNFGVPGTGPVLKKGMTLALEPMLNAGNYRTRTMPDGWTVRTADGSLSVHYEHTVAITDGEAEVLTRPSYA
jgi:methionyl aminopeptidase